MTIDTLERITKGIYHRIYRSEWMPEKVQVLLVYTIAYPTLWICHGLALLRIDGPDLLRALLKIPKIVCYLIATWTIESLTGIIMLGNRLFRR